MPSPGHAPPQGMPLPRTFPSPGHAPPQDVPLPRTFPSMHACNKRLEVELAWEWSYTLCTITTCHFEWKHFLNKVSVCKGEDLLSTIVLEFISSNWYGLWVVTYSLRCFACTCTFSGNYRVSVDVGYTYKVCKHCTSLSAFSQAPP